MATKKKPKAKAKKKKSASSKATRAKKPLKKTAVKKKTKIKSKPAAKTKRGARAPVATKQAVVSAPPGATRVGMVTHYYSHLSVAIVQLETGSIRAGDVIHIKGHTSDFTQPVESMEIDHVHVDEVHPGQSFGLRVKQHAREHDIVYKATS